MMVFDEDTCRFLAANDAAIQRYGYSREEFLQLTVYDIRPPEDRALIERVLAGVRGRPVAPPRTYRHQTRAGELIDVDITSHAITFDGRPARFVVAVDVTQRERAIGALRDSDTRLQESEARFRQLAETIDSVFYLIDVASGSVLYISPAYERVWEQSCESLLADGTSYLRRVHPGDITWCDRTTTTCARTQTRVPAGDARRPHEVGTRPRLPRAGYRGAGLSQGRHRHRGHGAEAAGRPTDPGAENGERGAAGRRYRP